VIRVHEFGLASGVLDAVRNRAAGRPVRHIRLRAGVRHGIDTASMAQAFEYVAKGTEAEGATVDVVAVPARLTCRSCGESSDSYDVLACCPRCDAGTVDLAGGDEFVLESLTYAATCA
jgi:hydrogenase nickel incorporation protein HypA/HybF